jgi:hypothetical protein
MTVAYQRRRWVSRFIGSSGETKPVNSEPSERDSRSNARNYKVARVSEKYALDDMDAELVARWRGESREQTSLRDLADFFNRRVLEKAMESAGRNPLRREIEDTYAVLSDDDVDHRQMVAAERKLARDGIDVEGLRDDFVTHQAIHSYLRNHLDVSPPEGDDRSRIEKETETLQKLQSRTESVTENIVTRLRKTDQLDVEDPIVLVNVTITCQECGNSYRAEELFERGHCRCSEPGSP